MWLVNECRPRILPEAVTLKRFLAPEWVFILGIATASKADALSRAATEGGSGGGVARSGGRRLGGVALSGDRRLGGFARSGGRRLGGVARSGDRRLGAVARSRLRDFG